MVFLDAVADSLISDIRQGSSARQPRTQETWRKRATHGTPRWGIGQDDLALTRYGVRLGALVERHMAEAALVAARREAERQADEARQAKREIEAVNAALRDEMAVRLRTESRLAYLASHDPLTALPNRTLFYERLSFGLEDARRHGGRLALLCVDLDNFGDVNDTLGHAAGDLVLKEVSARIESELRPGEMAARMGGDEFAVLHHDPADAAETRARTERLLRLFGSPFQIDARSIFLTASIGISQFPDDGDSVDSLRRNADLAMYRAKTGGGNRSQLFDKSLNDEMHRRSFLEQSLRDPDLLSQLYLVFQPQTDMRTSSGDGRRGTAAVEPSGSRADRAGRVCAYSGAVRHDPGCWRLGIGRDLPACDALAAGWPAAFDGGGQRRADSVPRGRHAAAGCGGARGDRTACIVA